MLVNILNTARCASVDIKSVSVQMRFSAFIIFLFVYGARFVFNSMLSGSWRSDRSTRC